MTTTIQELVAHLKHYPDNTVVTIKDVDDGEFVIVDYQSVNNTLEIIIGSKVDNEGDEGDGD
ncbi:MAG: hypothetical protein V7L23_12500 [Nostoc sp.]|uniref:hypothetical protein n=1 Tax=Nostoc sp. TaxID=1180 RepID=UPI002FF3BBE3